MQSIVSYPSRGPWGKSSWRGNTTGHLLVDLFGHFRPGHVVDPAEGSGTTGDVCRDMGISYEGFDLHSGFNLLTNPLAQACSTAPDMVFFHPPYGDMITYSGDVWGEPTDGDLSRCHGTAEFVDKLQLALVNIYDALRRDGHYAVLIGDQRKNGEYRSFQADVIAMGIGSLRNVVIKAQHNCVSDRRQYSGRFIPIRHEYLLVFCKDLALHAIGLAATLRLSKAFYGTWRNLVEFALRSLGGQASLSDLYRFIGVPEGHQNNHVQAKVRQVLQKHFPRIERGVYALAA